MCVLILLMFSALLLTSSGQDISSTCDDCVHFVDCPAAFERALHHKNEETRKLILDALCGIEYTKKEIAAVPKVCCHKFGETEEEKHIKNHPNQNLLPAKCGAIDGNRIVGGQIANLYEFPWMALISHETRNGLSFKCGGSIINKRYILTAAHCVYQKRLAGVRVGEYDITTLVDCVLDICESYLQDIRVEKVIIHESYQGLPRVINDIALLRLNRDIDFNHKNIDSICLPRTTTLLHNPLGNKVGTVAGWGLTENGTESSVLLKVNIPILTAEACSGLYNRYSKKGDPDVTEKQLCAGKLNKDSCNGDSGGPLMLEDRYNGISRFVQYGVVSHGPQKCGSNYPGVYTDLRHYMRWILDNITE